MTALTQGRNTPARLPGDWYGPVEANAAGFAGGICAYNAAGNIVNGQAAVGLTAAGRIEHDFSNAGGPAGAFDIRFETGVFGLNNSPAGADLVTRAMIGDPVYMVDDNTIAATNNGGAGAATRSVMGKLIDIDVNGVCWVFVGQLPTPY